MKLRIISWNTFGNSFDKISEVSKRLFCHESDVGHIILIQEAGVINPNQDGSFKIGRRLFNGCFAEDPNAQTNKRCTTGMLVEKNITLTGAGNPDFVTVGDARRPVLFISLVTENTRTYIATIHATANCNVSKIEIPEICEWLDGTAKSLGWNWLLMGDFNIVPSKLKKDEDIKKFIQVPEKCQFTHIGRTNMLLDYAAVSPSLVDAIAQFNVGEYSGQSDHIPIYIDIDL